MKNTLILFTTLAATTTFAGTHTHDAGFSFDLPTGWKLGKSEGNVQVIQRPGQTDREFYAVIGESGVTAKSSRDAALQAQDDTDMAKLGFTSRVGEDVDIKIGAGNGVLAMWAKENDGVQMDFLVFSVVFGGKRAALFALADHETVVKVAEDLGPIFASFRTSSTSAAAPGEGGEVAQQWTRFLSNTKLVKTSVSNHNGGVGNGGQAGETFILLNADGTFYYKSTSVSFIDVQGMSMHSESNDEDRGTWKVVVKGGKPVAVLKNDKGEVGEYPLKMRGEYLEANGMIFEIVRR